MGMRKASFVLFLNEPGLDRISGGFHDPLHGDDDLELPREYLPRSHVVEWRLLVDAVADRHGPVQQQPVVVAVCHGAHLSRAVREKRQNLNAVKPLI